MDHNKINYDLVVAILEWIVGEEHEVLLHIHEHLIVYVHVQLLWSKDAGQKRPYTDFVAFV